MPQWEQVLQHLKTYRSITTWGAITAYRITRLSGRIYELRRMGYKIDDVPVYDPNSKKRHVRYELVEG